MSAKPAVRCADRLGLLGSKGVRGPAFIAVPIILFSNLLGRYAWIPVAIVFVVVVFRLIAYMSASKHQACPVCGSEGKSFSAGGR
jgi:hypothetical protein